MPHQAGGRSLDSAQRFIILAVIGPDLAPYEATRVDFGRLEAPSLSHPFGTDNLLRDLFSRVLIATRNTLGIAFAAIFVSISYVGLRLTREPPAIPPDQVISLRTYLGRIPDLLRPDPPPLPGEAPRPPVPVGTPE